jgi:MFS family permease
VGVVREQVTEARQGFAAIWRNRGLRTINLALVGSVVGDWAYGIAVSIWAYQEGGATALGVFGVVRYVTMAVAAPFASTLGDKFPRKAVMIGSDVVRAALVVIGAALVASDGPAIAVYGLALATSVVGAAFRPAQGALIPTLANDPSELTGANVVASTIESVGFFIGPAIGGALLAIADIPVVYLFNAATFVWSALVLVRLPSPARPSEAVEPPIDGESGADEPSEKFLVEVVAGFRTILHNRNLLLVAGLFAAQTVVAGASLVFEVAIVFDLLERGEPTLGMVNAVLGVGGLIGGVVALVLARRERIATDFGIGVLLWAAPLLIIVAWPTLPSVLVAMLFIGLANSLVDINAFTIVQRLAPTDVMSRVFGALESVIIGGMAVGAAIMPLLIATVGLRTGLAILGVGVSVLVLIGIPALARVDRTVLAPPGLSLLRKVPMLAMLPPAALERLGQSLVSMSLPAGSVVFREGDPGDRYWIIESGRVEVSAAGERLRELGPGEGFGEIALLRDVPRTATVTALDDVVLKGLDRHDFIPAVTGHSESYEAAESVVNRLLTLS